MWRSFVFLDMFKLSDATEAHIPAIREIAEKTWWPTYTPILTSEQIEYMLATLYSEEELRGHIEKKTQVFIMLEDENGMQGFASFGRRKEENAVFKLHKIYVLPTNQGKGYGKTLIEEVKKRIMCEGGNTLDLNVNRFNPARSFYEKLGFRILREEDIPIGPYWMNDYVMRLIF